MRKGKVLTATSPNFIYWAAYELEDFPMPVYFIYGQGLMDNTMVHGPTISAGYDSICVLPTPKSDPMGYRILAASTVTDAIAVWRKDPGGLYNPEWVLTDPGDPESVFLFDLATQIIWEEDMREETPETLCQCELATLMNLGCQCGGQ